MKNIIVNRKTIALILLTVSLIFSIEAPSHGFFFELIGAIGQAVGAVGQAIGAVGQAVGAVVSVVAETVVIAAGVLGLSISILATFIWHTDSLWDIEPFPNGGIIGVVVSSLIHLWDPLTEQTTATLKHDAMITDIAFSSDGLCLAGASEDRTIQLWNPETQILEGTLRGHTDDVLSIDFNPEGLRLASGSADGTVRLWNPETQAPQGVLRGHTDDVLDVAFSPDGLLLASASTDDTVRLWNLQTEQPHATFKEHTDDVLDVAFSPDGLLLASASTDGTVRLWNLQTEQPHAMLDHKAPVLSIAFSPDREMIATGCEDGTARMWDPHKAEVLATLGHESPVRTVVFNDNGRVVVTGSADGKMRQWEITSEDDSRNAFESSTPEGYTRVTLSNSGTVWGIPTKYTTDSNVGKVTYILLAKLKDCDFVTAELARESKVYIKTQSLGHLSNFQSESVCGTSSEPWTSSWNGVRITHLRFFDESSPSDINEAIYNASTDQYELTSTTSTNQPGLTPTTAESTIIQIQPASVASPTIEDQLTLTLNITGGKAVAGYQATVQFDETALRYVSGVNGDYLSEGAFFVEPKVEGNLVRLAATSLAEESSGNGTLATLVFQVTAVKASELTLSDVLLSNSAGKSSRPQVEGAQITEPIQLKEDVNGDGSVNLQDLLIVNAHLGQTGENKADVNGDGIVNVADLALVAGAIGNDAGAPSLHPEVLEIFSSTNVKQWLSQLQHLDFTDARLQRGILFLQQLLVALTPEETVLLANYPNPFNPETWIPYHLAKDANVTLHIYAVNGQLVRTLTLGHQAAGMYQSRSRAAYWDGKNEFGEPVSSGVYFYTLTAGDFTATRKMLIRK